jgi:hypothetical protein
MADNKSDNPHRETYGLEPEEGGAGKSPAGRDAASGEHPSAADREGLLDDFDEDADFDRDPEVERALEGEEPAKEEVPQDSRPELVKPWFDAPKALAVAGGILLAAALVTTWVTAPDEPMGRTVARTLLTLYQTAVHTGTGVVAVLVTALFLDLRPGRLDLAAGRMFVAVAAFQIVAHMNIWLEIRLVEIALGAVLYAAIVAGLFRLWKDRLLVLVISHFGLVMAMQIGMWLTGAVAVG